MEINLNFLKFHYFCCNKDIHNLCVKEFVEYLENIIFCKQHSLLSILISIKKCNSDIKEIKNVLIKFHDISGNHRDILLNKIIRKQHPHLYDQIEQYFSNINFKNISFYQCKIDKQERLIFTIHTDFKKQKTFIFIPLIFDLNHVIYKKDKEKNYENKNLIDCYKWDLKKEQEKYKMRLKEELKMN